MKINLDDVNGEQIQCVRAVDLPRGAALLLNAHAAAKLDIISAPLSERGGAASDMREIECIVDLQRLRDSRLIGPDETTFDAIDCVPDALPTPIVWPQPCWTTRQMMAASLTTQNYRSNMRECVDRG